MPLGALAPGNALHRVPVFLIANTLIANTHCPQVQHNQASQYRRKLCERGGELGFGLIAESLFVAGSSHRLICAIAPKEASEVQAGLNIHFDTLDQIASEAHLKPSSFARLTKAKARDGPLSTLTETEVSYLEEQARLASELFQRSSSCVEGRNGQLSLRHHGLREISPRKLRVLGVLHNFVIKRRDGSTAANRFFGQKHRELFPWLLEHMPLPPRPRRKAKS